MGLFGRLGTLIRSNINELINRAEDPEKMLNQVLVDMKGQLVEAKKQVAVAIADEKRIKKQYEQELLKAQDWERKAMLAIRAGDDNLARAALARKAEHDELANTLKIQWEAQKQSVEQLKEALRGLDQKIKRPSASATSWSRGKSEPKRRRRSTRPSPSSTAPTRTTAPSRAWTSG